jgi:hypothetical protein
VISTDITGSRRPMRNAGMRLATVTPLGAFALID